MMDVRWFLAESALEAARTQVAYLLRGGLGAGRFEPNFPIINFVVRTKGDAIETDPSLIATPQK